MKAGKRITISMALATAALMASATAWAHATLLESSPPKNAELAVAPKEVTLRFNEKLEASFSNAKLFDRDGKQIATDKAALDAADPALLRLPVPALQSGGYTVEYAVVGHDGHRRKGEIRFTVK
jgi:hypothetical protein